MSIVDRIAVETAKRLGDEFSVGDIRKIMNEIFTGEPTPPQGEPLIQGYTAEQWQEIIDGGYLCVVGDASTGHIRQIVSKEQGDTGVWKFKATSGFETHSCRPSQLKGVMRPIFVEPADKEAECVFFAEEGNLFCCKFNELPRLFCATKYIEL